MCENHILEEILEDSDRVLKSETRDTYFDYIDSRRLLLLRVLLSLSLLVALAFIPVNISLNIWSLVYVEIALVVFFVAMLTRLRNTKNIERCSAVFVTVAATWAIIAAAVPSTDYSTFVWNAYIPAATFFLLGKRRGFVLCSVYVPTIIAIFLYRHFFASITQPIVVVLNLILYTIFISILYLYYESTRAHTEKLLIDDIKRRKKTEAEKVALIDDLKKALTEVKKLSGLLPVCSSCKKIRDDKGYWNKLEIFIEERSEAQFSHGMCPKCASDLYPDIDMDFESEYKKDFPAWTGEEQEEVSSAQKC